MKRLAILLVEDNESHRVMSAAMLVAAGYRVNLANCVAEARSWLERHSQPAALITDIELGDGDDGFDLAYWARIGRPGLPVVYVSSQCVSRFAKDGVADSQFVTKPFAPSDLLQAVERVMCVQPSLPSRVREPGR
jgi:DNA-binding NtrC family response regulator